MIDKVVYVIPILTLAYLNFDLEDFLKFFLQLLITLTSAALFVLMVKYTSKRALDVALMLREFAVIILFARFVVYTYFDFTNIYMTLFTYIFLAITCILVIVFLLNEHRPRHYEDKVTLIESKENSDGGYEEV